MTASNDGHDPDGRVSRRAPARVDSSARVNVALPFSQFKIQEPSDHLRALTALVEDVARRDRRGGHPAVDRRVEVLGRSGQLPA